MKKQKIAKYLKPVFLLFTISILLWSCEKESHEIISQSQPSISLKKVKKQFYASFNREAFSTLPSPQWDKTKVFYDHMGNPYLEIPFQTIHKQDIEKGTSVSFDRLIAFSKENTIELRIVHYFGIDIVNNYVDFKELSHKELYNFSGFVTRYDLNKNVLSVNKYTDGVKSKAKYFLNSKKKSDILSKVDEGCTTTSETIIVENCVFWRYQSGRIEIIECWYDQITRSYESCSEDGGGNEGYTSHVRNEETYQIKDSKLKPCMKKIMDSIKNLSTGLSGIIKKFSGDSSTGFNWTLKDGTTTNGGTGQTSSIYDKNTKTVTSTFDTQKWDNASELSWARTILHESVHAYIIASFGVDYISSKRSFADFIYDYDNKTYPSRSEAEHAEFVRNYVGDIKSSLKEYGIKKGYTLSDQFYNDMAWGGLTHWNKRNSAGNIILDSSGNPIKEETSWFKATFPNASDRNRVLNTNAIELTKKDMNGNTKTPKGNDAGC